MNAVAIAPQPAHAQLCREVDQSCFRPDTPKRIRYVRTWYATAQNCWNRLQALKAPQPQTRLPPVERIFAYRGYFVATSTQPAGDGRFIGLARICIERPEHAADAVAIEKLSSVGAYPDEARALGAAEFQAKQVLDGLQPNWEPFTAPGSLARR